MLNTFSINVLLLNVPTSYF